MTPNYGYNGNYTIVQTADYVMIHTEMVHDTRVIRIGEPKPLPDHIRPWFGDSWGHWEGDTLVVETTNIYSLQSYPTEPISQLVSPGVWGIRPTENLKVTERFTRVDEETILYEYSCHEGNYGLANILSGARYQERQAGRNQPR